MIKNNFQNNKFNFFVEADLKKAKDNTGKEVVWIEGIASSSSVADSDEETLYPSGFNLQPFLESGLVNYNHQGSKDANANIGVPIEAKVINNGKDLYVKCMLWPCPQTTGIVTAYEAFQKYNIDRKIGFSIEGRATMRGSIFKEDPAFKKILKADVSGLAVTFCPKNRNTLMNIVKGEYQEAFIPLDDEEDDEKEKSMDTEAMAPATPESVEHDPKDISNNNFVSNKKLTNFDKDLKKSDIYTTIAQRFPQTSIAVKKQIFSFVEEVNSKLFKMEVVTPEVLKKALDLINDAQALVKGEVANDPIVKSEEVEAEPDAAEVEKACETARILMKSGMAKEAACDVLTKGGFALNVAQASWEKALSETQAQQNGGEPEAQAAPIMKSEEITALVGDKIKEATTPLSEAIQKSLEGFQLAFKSLQDQNTELIKSNQEFTERLQKLESTPVGRKSFPNAKAVEKFAKSQDASTSDENTFDVTSKQDLDRLTDFMLEEHGKAIEKGKTADASLWEGAISTIEATNKVPEYAYRPLAQRGIKLIAP